jgi:hypothetical protein
MDHSLGPRGGFFFGCAGALHGRAGGSGGFGAHPRPSKAAPGALTMAARPTLFKTKKKKTKKNKKKTKKTPKKKNIFFGSFFKNRHKVRVTPKKAKTEAENAESGSS